MQSTNDHKQTLKETIRETGGVLFPAVVTILGVIFDHTSILGMANPKAVDLAIVTM